LACGAGIQYTHANGYKDYEISDHDIPPLIKLAAHGVVITCRFCNQQHLIQFDMLEELYLKEVNIWE